MGPEHTDAFFGRLTGLAELFDAQFSPAKGQLYFDALADLPFDVVVGALNAAARTCKFMPRPAELRTLALGDDEDAAERAWMALQTAIRRVGGHDSLVTTDAALGDAIVAIWGSWPEACQADLSPEMRASTRKQFGRVYRVLRARHLPGPRYLTGLVERHNGLREAWRRFTAAALLHEGAVRRLTAEEAEPLRTQARQLTGELAPLVEIADAVRALAGRQAGETA